MDGVHDLGGMDNFGPVRPEADEPRFHDPWEARVLALTLAAGGLGRWNLDQMRFQRELLPPAVYLASSYYEIWARSLESALVRAGLVTEVELAGDARPAPDDDGPRAVAWEAMESRLRAGAPTTREPGRPARYAVGDRVRTIRAHPHGHTRLPRYARDTCATVEAIHGAHIYPDRHAAAFGPPFDQRPEWLYTVSFEAGDLWGDDADPAVRVSVDAWEPYLEPAG